MCVFCNLSSPLQKGVTLNVVIHIQIILSVVADKENPKGDRLLLRSRIAGDIEEVFPSADVMYDRGPSVKLHKASYFYFHS